MSAYLCSERELSVLAAYALRFTLDRIPAALTRDVEGDGFERRPGGWKRTHARVFSCLLSENLASLSYRYPDDKPSHAASFDTYAPIEAAERIAVMETPKLHIIKLCHHYAYQSCEHPGWKDSNAKRIIDAVEAHAVHHLPGYDAAPWGI